MLELLNVDRFDEMYGIMEYSFPESERRSREGQRKLFADPRYKVAAQSDERGRLEAFLAYWQLEKVTFLEHFAVAADLRGAGLGGRFLDELLTTLKKPVLLEAEPPETDVAARRIAFYERHMRKRMVWSTTKLMEQAQNSRPTSQCRRLVRKES